MVGGRTPAKPRWSEVIIFLDVLLRQRAPCRRRMPAPIRRVLVGGDDLLGCSPPAGSPLPEENASPYEAGAHPRTDLRRVAQLRGENAGRRRMHGGRMNSGEAAVVGGDDLFWIPFSGTRGARRTWATTQNKKHTLQVVPMTKKYLCILVSMLFELRGSISRMCSSICS